MLLFAPNLSGGGAERTLARLATHWAEAGHDVTLITLADVSPEDFPISASVSRRGLGLAADSRVPFSAISSNLRRVWAIRSAFRDARPDVVVSFIEQANVLALLAAHSLNVPVVVSERTDPALHAVGRSWGLMRKLTYRRSAAIVVLTEAIAEHIRPIAGGRPLIVIPNGVAPASVPRVSEEQREERTVLGVGRLSPEKGFDTLVNVFAYAAVDHSRWRLVLVGEGPDRPSLEKLAIAHAAAVRIELPGRIADPSGWYAQADLFALPSRYEGFPNALLEAMAAGVPAVAFDGSAAVRQVIRHGIDGLLVPYGQSVGFWEAIRTLIEDDDRRHQMGEAARDVVNRFSLDDFFRRWDDVITTAAKRKISQPLRGKSE